MRHPADACMNWLNRNASAIEALGTITTALVALAVLIAIPWQIRASAALQAEQSARDIYREFVALSVNKPGFADPDYCAIKTDPLRLTAYSYYMEYLLYTAEQVTAVSDTWIPVMQSHLSQHHRHSMRHPRRVCRHRPGRRTDRIPARPMRRCHQLRLSRFLALAGPVFRKNGLAGGPMAPRLPIQALVYSTAFTS